LEVAVFLTAFFTALGLVAAVLTTLAFFRSFPVSLPTDGLPGPLLRPAVDGVFLLTVLAAFLTAFLTAFLAAFLTTVGLRKFTFG
jgi:hypothetical protein